MIYHMIECRFWKKGLKYKYNIYKYIIYVYSNWNKEFEYNYDAAELGKH